MGPVSQTFLNWRTNNKELPGKVSGGVRRDTRKGRTFFTSLTKKDSGGNARDVRTVGGAKRGKVSEISIPQLCGAKLGRASELSPRGNAYEEKTGVNLD